MTLLTLLILSIVALVGLILFITDTRTVKLVGLYGSFVLLAEALLLWVYFDRQILGYQYGFTLVFTEHLGITYSLGVDGISLFFIILSVFLLPVCILCSWASVEYRVKEFIILLYLITLMLVHVFTVLDLFLFYIFFESVLIPMFLMIGIWGSRDRKIHAAYQFFLYTLVGSVLMLLGVIYIYVKVGSTHVSVLCDYPFTKVESCLLWLSFFASFAVKVPMLPVHIWLPEAHVEAPTAGSVLLAGILLKMGTYGLIRFSLPMFPDAVIFFQPLVYAISIVSIIYAACTTIRQIDLKKIIAYSSVVHMNYVTLGIASNNVEGIEGSIFLMISHGLVSGALFICVGFLYERYSTRSILYYGGLTVGMPVFAVFFLLFTLANVSLPLSTSFIGEFLVLVGTFQVSTGAAFMAIVGIVLGAVYAFWLYNRVVFGHCRMNLVSFADLNLREGYLMGLLLIPVVYLGVYPYLMLDYMHGPVLSCIQVGV